MVDCPISGVHPTNLIRSDYGYPDFMIILLDELLGKETDYIRIKTKLFLAINPTNTLFEEFISKSDNDIRLDQFKFIFNTFDNYEECFLAIDQNIQKRIFVLVSTAKGRLLIPTLIGNFEDEFQSKKNKIYMYDRNTFLSNVQNVIVSPSDIWKTNFVNNFDEFNNEEKLLVCLISDIADYLLTEADKYEKDNKINIACQHYEWAKRMYQRCQLIEPSISKMEQIKNIDQCLKAIEQQHNPGINDNQTSMGQEDRPIH